MTNMSRVFQLLDTKGALLTVLKTSQIKDMTQINWIVKVGFSPNNIFVCCNDQNKYPAYPNLL